jgi:hypothetical protein
MSQKNSHFVYVVDSSDQGGISKALNALGLKSDENYHVTGAGGASMLLDVRPWISSEKLLVFMSSFHGSVAPAVELSKEIKAANPNARIIFRSTTDSADPVFEKNMRKDWNYAEITKLTTEFLAS